MGRFRYDDNEEDEYDIDRNGANDGFGWEFVAANPGEEGALVPVENDREIFEDQHYQQQPNCQPGGDDDQEDTTSSSPVSHSHQQQQQQHPIFYVVMQQDPMDSIYHHANHPDGGEGFYDYDHHSRRRTTYCCGCCPPTWLIMCLVALISHISWHVIHHGPPAPPPLQPLAAASVAALDSSNNDEDHPFSSTTRTRHSSTHSPETTFVSFCTWQEYLDNHGNTFLHSTRALFWEMPKHVVTWWFRYLHDEIQQRVQDWNTIPLQYCAISLSSLHHGHERMQQFIMQQGTSSSILIEDPAASSSLSSSSSLPATAGLFFAKGQPLAMRAVADALHTWRPASSSQTTTSSSLSFPPLLLFASAMTPGLAMHDSGTTLSQVLIPSSECEQRNHKVQKHQRLFRRPLLHLEATSDWDQDTLARQILDHVMEWTSASRHGSTLSPSGSSSIHDDDAGGGIVVLQHVHQLAPSVFAWLIRELSTPPTPHGTSTVPSSFSSTTSSSSQLYLHCQNVIFLFTSDTIGKASIVRSIRQAATSAAQAAMVNQPPLVPVHDDDNDDETDSSNSNGRLRRPLDLVHDISRPSLTLDIQHEMQVHLGGASSLASSMHAILPFLPYTQLDLAEILTLGMQQYWQESCQHCHEKQEPEQQHSRWSRLVTTRNVVQALVHERNVEYIVWKTVINSGNTSPKGTRTTADSGSEASSIRTPRRLPVVLLTFSSTGSDPVQRHLLSIQAHLERCLQKAIQNDRDDPRLDEEKFQSAKILVLDSSDETGQRGILKECQQQDSDDVLDGLTRASTCSEICSFPLV